MRGGIALLAVPFAAVAPSAYADVPPPSADLRMVYERPQIAKDNAGVTWRWVLTNSGAAGAETVIATHRVSADQKIVGISQPCAGQGNDVVCQLGAIKPGQKQSGWIRTKVARPGGTLRVNAQVTWRESQNILPGAGDPSPVDASDSWGAAGTDATTEMPGQDATPTNLG